MMTRESPKVSYHGWFPGILSHLHAEDMLKCLFAEPLPTSPTPKKQMFCGQQRSSAKEVFIFSLSASSSSKPWAEECMDCLASSISPVFGVVIAQWYSWRGPFVILGIIWGLLAPWMNHEMLLVRGVEYLG